MTPPSRSNQPATRYRQLAELAIGHLEAAGTPQPAAVLTAQVMGPAFAKQPSFVGMVEDLLAADDRFARDDAGRWRLAGWPVAESRLDGQVFAVVDVETTGGRGEQRRVVEVAAILVCGARIAGQYESLVRPASPVTRLSAPPSGITPDLLDGAPPAADVLTALRSFLGDAVIAGHNVGGALSFLNYEALWHGLPPFGNAALDTEELAGRLLPDLKRPGLARVATALGLAQPVRHRALPDARLAAQVLLALLPRVHEQGMETFEALQAWLSSRLATRQARVRHVGAALPAGALHDLPEAPGVYSFHDVEGHVLYVGKAASLRGRVAQHFSSASLAARHHDALLDRTVRISHEVVPCELDALLLESARIRALRPPYNVMERSRRGCPFLRLEAGPFPRFSAATAVADDGHEYFGPYRTTQDVQRLLGTLRRVFQIRSCRRALPARRKAMAVPCARLDQQLCPGPCANLVTPEAYGALVDLARTYVRFGRHAALEAAQARLADVAGEPLHALVAEICRRLRRVRRDVFPVEGGRAGGAVLMGYPTGDSSLRLFLVRDGQLLARQSVRDDDSARGLARLLDPVPSAQCPVQSEGAGNAGCGSGSEEALDADQANILLRWLHRHLDRPEVVPLPPRAGTKEIAGAIEALLCRSHEVTGGPAGFGLRTSDFGPGSTCAQPCLEPDVEAEVMDGGEAFGGGVLDLEEMP